MLVDGEYLLEKFPEKGGWTYIKVPSIKPDKKAPFGWVCVKGFIDDYELKQYKLMPMGDDSMFLPVKAQIRKQIKKEAGDIAHIRLSLDNSPTTIPKEIYDCLEMEDAIIKERFDNLNESHKKAYIDHIYSAKTEATKVKRIAEMISNLSEE